MPYQPTAPYPYLKTIDASADNIFTCVINPRDVITKYILKIYDNNTGDLVLTVTEDEDERTYSGASQAIISPVTTNLSLPFYGTTDSDECLEIPIPANYILNKSGEDDSTPDADRLFGDFVWNITLYSSDTDYIDSCDYFFMVRDEAIVTLINRDTEQPLDDTNEITSSQILLDCDYHQAQNIHPLYCRFDIYLGGDKIYTTGNIISSNIKFDYESLVSGNTYELEFIVGTDDRTEYRYTYTLNVNYEYRTPFVNPKATADNNVGCINVNFSNNIAIQGKYDVSKTAPSYARYIDTDTELPPSEGSYNAVSIPNGQTVYWDERAEDIPLNLDKTEQIMNWHGHEGFSGDIISKYDPHLLSSKMVIGHDVPKDTTHGNNDYTDISDPAMPIGETVSDIQAGFYYQYGSGNKTYISEFDKIASAIYETDYSSIQDVEESDITIDDDTLYILNDTDTLDDDDIILTNDTTFNYWWTIAMLSDRAFAKKNQLYSDTIPS